jgi:hypothetical protein
MTEQELRDLIRETLIESMDSVNENRDDPTKMFDQSTVDKISSDIKKMIKFEDGKYNTSFDYTEYRFGDGSGGFSFKWNHSRNWGGQIGVSFDTSGKHKYYNYSWYDKSKHGAATVDSSKPFKFKGNPVEWRDFTNEHLLEFWKKVKSDIKKNEKGAKSALSKEAQAQSDYYGSKASTGRIGYGLTQQPRR